MTTASRPSADALAGAGLMDRLDALARLSERPDMLVRRFLTDRHAQANALVGDWMREAGMAVRIDAIGNVVGRLEGGKPGLPALVVGSHLDTVVDAGRYDGMLGVVTGVACARQLAADGVRLPFALEVVGFADEEGARFGATLLGSRALAGRFDLAALELQDDDGVSMEAALRRFGLDPAAIPSAARSRDEILAYVELHIEQGPVLEAEDLPVGRVTAICGASRFVVRIAGEAGHAGTVPMHARRDAAAAMAECILAVERQCQNDPGLVGTVGVVEAAPGAVNIIPGQARFTIDLRSPEDAARRAAETALRDVFQTIAERRGVAVTIERTHDAASTPCAPWLAERIDAAISGRGIRPFALASGAGHDGMAVAAIADIGMIFVRCARGISHNPAESITAADAETGARVLYDLIRNFRSGSSS